MSEGKFPLHYRRRHTALTRVASTHGPLVNAKASIKVEEHVQDAIRKGAKALVGGKRGPGAFFEPTVLVDISRDAVVLKEETFGPLAPLIKFETEDEVIRLANDTEFGLAGWVAVNRRCQFR